MGEAGVLAVRYRVDHVIGLHEDYQMSNTDILCQTIRLYLRHFSQNHISLKGQWIIAGSRLQHLVTVNHCTVPQRPKNVDYLVIACFTSS